MTDGWWLSRDWPSRDPSESADLCVEWLREHGIVLPQREVREDVVPIGNEDFFLTERMRGELADFMLRVTPLGREPSPAGFAEKLLKCCMELFPCKGGMVCEFSPSERLLGLLAMSPRGRWRATGWCGLARMS